MLLGSACAAAAQASLQVPLKFDFLNPGARSLAVGSGFVGMADDATSAFTNPAGLTILRFPELSFEVRGRHLESPFLRGGRLSGTLTNQGIDTERGPLYGDSPASSTGLSYLSFVVGSLEDPNYPPDQPRPVWRVAGYRHEFVRLEQQFEALGAFQRESLRELALRARRDISITAYGVAGAYQFTPRLSIGAGVGVYDFHLEAEFSRFFSPSFYEAPTFAPSTHIGHAEQVSDHVGVGFNVGALWTVRDAPRAVSGVDLIRLGVVYRRGASFDFEAFEGSIDDPTERNGTFKVPDALAAGVAMRFARASTITAELTFVQYQALLDGYVSSQSVGSGKSEYFNVDNGVEAHVGFEYLFNLPKSPALRVGLWRDPDHAIRYDPPSPADVLDERFAAYLPRRGDDIHLTFGGGFALTRRIGFNIGADLSGRTRLISTSAVVRFTKARALPIPED